MTLRARLLLLSVSTVAAIVFVLIGVHLTTLTATWLESAVERNEVAGGQIQAFMLRRIEERVSAHRPAPRSVEETKQLWSDIVAEDEDLAAILEQAMAQSRTIIEINITSERGITLASSNPLRRGHAISTWQDLKALRDSGPLDRLWTMVESRNDWESRMALGIPGQKAPVFQIQMLVSPVLLRAAILPELRSTAIVSLMALLAAAGLAYLSANLALQPVKQIGRAIDTIAMGRPLGLLTEDENPEVAAIESKLSLLGAQVQGAMKDADQARTAIGKLARGVAHEIKNPLNSIALRLEALRGRVEEVPEAEGEIDILSREVTRLDQVVGTFLDLSRPVELELRKADLAQIAGSVVELVRPTAERSGVRIELSQPAEPVAILVDDGLLRQALLNVVNNAVEAMPNGGRLDVEVWRRDDMCEISIADNGPGIPAEIRDRIFEPYFTTKERGSGIGLAVTARTVKLHGGSVRVESEPERGTRFILALPDRAGE